MSLHVVIIGGGIGGLCLAQGLRKAGISATVCERDQSAGFRRQGYRISLKPTGAGALHECLPAHLFDLAVATSIRMATRMVFLDEQLYPKFEKPLVHDPPGPGGFGVNRLTLREILLAGLDVAFGKTFTGYSPGGLRTASRYLDLGAGSVLFTLLLKRRPPPVQHPSTHLYFGFLRATENTAILGASRAYMAKGEGIL